MSEEDIAARHFVSAAIVKQRLRLASVSPKLHDVYADDGMTLEQLMAFSVTADQARQEQVWDNVSRSRYDEPYQIRRTLTENNRYNDGRVSAHSVRQRLDHANVLARTVGLDMATVGWKPTADNYFGRVTKPRILEAVREAKGEPSVQLIDHLKKGDMAREAERLLDGTGWLPEALRLVEIDAAEHEAGGEAGALPEFLANLEDEAIADAEEERLHIIAAE